MSIRETGLKASCFLTPFGAGVLFLDNMYFTTEVVGVDDIVDSTPKIVVFPNPVASGANVFATSDVITMEVFNLSGQKIRTTNQSSINLHGVESGVYIVKVTDPKGVIHTDKLIVK